MIKILAIGNSFSQDATAYLYSIAEVTDVKIKVVNLYIGGCSLKTHWENVMGDLALYEYELNGQYTGHMISIREALEEEEWDYVTMQQVSGDSGIIDTYYPYILEISKYVSELAPSAEQLLHQTWAYELDSDHSDFSNYDCDQGKMYEAIEEVYQILAESLSLRVIPCGKVIQELRRYPAFDYGKGGHSLCRDGFHMDLIYGRYALAATWYEFIMKESILDNGFVPQELEWKEVETSIIQLIKKTVHDKCYS